MDEKNSQQPPRLAAVARKPHRGLRRVFRSLRLTGLLVIILIIAVAAAVYFYTKYQGSQDKLKHPEVLAKIETQSLIDKVGKHVELPTGEQPTVATVSDVSKLSNQTFFAGAKNSDKVLIYTKAKKAILYRPSEDKIINYAPLNINNSQ